MSLKFKQTLLVRAPLMFAAALVAIGMAGCSIPVVDNNDVSVGAGTI